MKTKITTTLGALAAFYGIDLMEFDSTVSGCTHVVLYRDGDGWHASAPYSDVDLRDDMWAHSDEDARLLGALEDES